MFSKMTTFSIGIDDIDVLDGEFLKTAAIKLPDGVDYDPDFFYMKVRAVSAGEFWGSNKNHDFFPEDELVNSYKTFLVAHTFKNHENKDIKNAIGDVLSAEWNDKMKSIELLLRIDRQIAPTIVRGFEKGFMTDVSMGCRISHSVCSICGNKAKTKFEYCEHIKYQRGKVLDDGRKVFEINIAPKFHDISAVLNGAERSAKAIGLMVSGSKVAMSDNENMFEKVANAPIEADSTNTLANNVIDYDLDMNTPKKMSKLAYTQKIAEIKKELQSKIVNVSKGQFVKDREDKVNDSIDLIKTLYTDYWDTEKCIDIANKIKYISSRNNCPLDATFHQFLKVLDFAGIELTPLEFHNIYSAVNQRKICDADKLPLDSSLDINESSTDIENNSMLGNMNLITLMNTISNRFSRSEDKIINSIDPDNSLGKIKTLIIKMKLPTRDINDDRLQGDIMKHIVRSLIPQRSFHDKYLIPRYSRVIKMNTLPNEDNLKHFLPIKYMSTGLSKTASNMPFILSGLLYSTYQDERVANYDNTCEGIMKFASDIFPPSEQGSMDKIAFKKSPMWTMGKAISIGVPAVYAYSAFQRARLRNGKRISSANRYIAENPTGAALLQVAFAPTINKNMKKLQNNDIAKSKNFDDFLYNKFANQYDTDMEKLSELYSGDIFTDTNIDKIALNKYSENELNIIKKATLLIPMGQEGLSDDILRGSNLTQDDIANYLKIASDYIKIEIEKYASDQLVACRYTDEIMVNKMAGTSSSLSGTPNVSHGDVINSFVFSNLFDRINSITN